MKNSFVVVLVIAAVGTSLSAAEQKLSQGIAGVPWSGSREAFKAALDGLTCAPIACSGRWTYHEIDGDLDLTWGGFSRVVTSSSFKFSSSDVGKMKRALTKELGKPKRQYSEYGELVTEWKTGGTLIDLYHGTDTEPPQLYIEPPRSK